MRKQWIILSEKLWGSALGADLVYTPNSSDIEVREIPT